MTPEEIKRTEELVNEAINRKLPVTCEEMSVEAARQKGAIGLFGDRYGEVVKVYSMGDFPWKSAEVLMPPTRENWDASRLQRSSPAAAA